MAAVMAALFWRMAKCRARGPRGNGLFSGCVYLLWIVHCALDRVCVSHARKFCKRRGLEIRRVRWRSDFEPLGDKHIATEYTQVQLDCLYGKKERRLVLVLVWPFGFRKLVSDVTYPPTYDGDWPQEAECPNRCRTLSPHEEAP